MCSEEYPHREDRDGEMEKLEQDWPKFKGPEHVAVSVLPSYLSGSSGDATMCLKVLADPVDYSEDMEAAKIEGIQFRSTYDKDIQFV